MAARGPTRRVSSAPEPSIAEPDPPTHNPLATTDGNLAGVTTMRLSREPHATSLIANSGTRPPRGGTPARGTSSGNREVDQELPASEALAAKEAISAGTRTARATARHDTSSPSRNVRGPTEGGQLEDVQVLGRTARRQEEVTRRRRSPTLIELRIGRSTRHRHRFLSQSGPEGRSLYWIDLDVTQLAADRVNSASHSLPSATAL